MQNAGALPQNAGASRAGIMPELHGNEKFFYSSSRATAVRCTRIAPVGQNS